jgi:hypothetical protein
MNIQSYRSHLATTSLSLDRTRELRANDTDGYALEAQPDKSQGRPTKSTGSKPIARFTACPTCVHPRPQVPVARAYARHDQTSNLKTTFSCPEKEQLASCLCSVWTFVATSTVTDAAQLLHNDRDTS